MEQTFDINLNGMIQPKEWSGNIQNTNKNKNIIELLRKENANRE